MEDKKYFYSEIFRSLQGEGTYTGTNSLWIRWFMCNLQCDGFGQKDPTNPDTYELPYKDLDLININSVEDLPVFNYGCDSSYTWSKKYKHLMQQETAKVIVDKLEDTLRSDSNPQGKFVHPLTLQETHMCFTGGEPMLKQNQKAIVATMEEFARRKNAPRYVTIETNGTTKLTSDIIELVDAFYTSSEYGGLIDDEHGSSEWFWSLSPKLFTTSGELRKKAIQPEVVGQYAKISNYGHLKYVVNGSDATWKEVEEVTKMFRDAGCNWPVYIMIVGATKEQQEDERNKVIVEEALARGYNISGRLHCHLLGNAIGT